MYSKVDPETEDGAEGEDGEEMRFGELHGGIIASHCCSFFAPKERKNVFFIVLSAEKVPKLSVHSLRSLKISFHSLKIRG